MRSITQLRSLKGKTVLVRVDFNVPVVGGRVLDDFRIRAALPTLRLLQKKGASLILVSHAGDDGAQSLAPIAKSLSRYIKTRFVRDSLPKNLVVKPREVVLLENIRREKGEKKNDLHCAKALAELADIYVNDAFPVSHRPHASIVGVPRYLPSYAGLQLEKEVAHLSRALSKPKKPFLFLLGGAKFETKMPLIKRFMKTADFVFVGGALANDFLKAAGFEVGTSLVEGKWDLSSLLKSKKLLLQSDAVVFDGKKSRITSIDAIRKKEAVVDIGPETVRALSSLVKEARTVLWNGPFGKYKETYGHKGTEGVLDALVKNKKCYSVIGGGDITAVVSKMKLDKKFSFVSTGGGATLEFLAKGTLPGIKALNRK